MDLENYKWSINTEVKFQDEWRGIVEVWFREQKVGLKSGHLINYSEVQAIRN